MFGTSNKRGFTLLEIMIAIAIIAIIATIVTPNIGRFLPRYEREKAISRFNALVQLGWQRALSTHKVHKIQCDLNTRMISLQEDSGQQSKKDEELFIAVKTSYLASAFEWPASLEIKQFFIEGFDEMARFAGRKKTAEIWFFIMPGGLTQDVIINIADTGDIKNGSPAQVSLVLNPFTAQFEIYDTFQKP